MLNNITNAAACLAVAALAQQELEEANPDARELADAWFDAFEELDAGRQLRAPYWPEPYYRMGYCRMRANPRVCTTYPYGAFWLSEYGPWAPMQISGYMRQMPGPNSRHGFTINSNQFNGRDCSDTEPTFNPWGMPQGSMNAWPSRVGDLNPITDINGNAWWHGQSWQPTFYGSNNVSARSMCIYERHGHSEQLNYGRAIACCNIQRFMIFRRSADKDDYQSNAAREPERGAIDEEGVKVIDERQFQQMFGEEFDPKKIMPDYSAAEDQEDRRDNDGPPDEPANDDNEQRQEDRRQSQEDRRDIVRENDTYQDEPGNRYPDEMH